MRKRKNIWKSLKIYKMEMSYLAGIGKKRTILISISVLMVSLHTMYFYNVMMPEVTTKKIVQQSIRFLLTVGLLVMLYRGKSWARITSIVLFSIGILGAFVGLITIDKTIILKSPLIVMLIVYSVALYHFWFSRSFKAFFEHQNKSEYKEN
jgi:hypothetical protein